VHGRVEVSVVGDVNRDRRALRDHQRRAGEGAVVSEHAHRRIADPLLDWRNLELELVAVRQFDQLRRASFGQPFGLARELDCLGRPLGAQVVHG
jgi:hypothetical protein